jgi:hypothetical protein
VETESRFNSFPIVEKREHRVGETAVFNYSGRPLGEALNLFPKNLSFEKIVIMPDLNPGRTPIPTGSSVELNEAKIPNWRKLVLSDIGCGMQVLATPINWTDFEANIDVWDSLYSQLKANKGGLGDLGSGNHFVDAVVDDDENLYFVIHTGSRNEATKAGGAVDNHPKFDRVYDEIQNWARENRNKVREMLQEAYGETTLLFDQPHNTFTHVDDKIVIYKGTVNLQPGKMSLIPSSMDSDMVIIEGNNEELEKINFAIAHGTGRIKSRGEAKEEAYVYDFEALRKRIHIPEAIPNESILTENPSCYKDLDQCLSQLSELIVVRQRLHPIAYIGQI